MLQRRKLGGCALFLLVTRIAPPARANAVTEPTLYAEKKLVSAIESLLNIIPRMEKVIGRVTNKNQIKQFYRGIAILNRHVSELLHAKRMIIKSISIGHVDVDMLKLSKEKISQRTETVQSALDFINPANFDYVFTQEETSGDGNFRANLLADFNQTEENFRHALTSKGAALTLITYAQIINNNKEHPYFEPNLPAIKEAIEQSEKSLIVAQAALVQLSKKTSGKNAKA